MLMNAHSFSLKSPDCRFYKNCLELFSKFIKCTLSVYVQLIASHMRQRGALPGFLDVFDRPCRTRARPHSQYQ